MITIPEVVEATTYVRASGFRKLTKTEQAAARRKKVELKIHPTEDFVLNAIRLKASVDWANNNRPETEADLDKLPNEVDYYPGTVARTVVVENPIQTACRTFETNPQQGLVMLVYGILFAHAGEEGFKMSFGLVQSEAKKFGVEIESTYKILVEKMIG